MGQQIEKIFSAAERLLNTVQQMAEQQTNPVLEVLGDQLAQLQLETKYPQPPLDFQQGPWRAFYHCHAVPDSELQEHGHFHLFCRSGEQWCHVAALSMTHEGQPQAWMAVNRWVTGGPWMSAQDLIQHLQCLDAKYQGLSLLETWLLCMVTMFSAEIETLLKARDAALPQINENTLDPVLLNNHDIYTLAVEPIDLLSKFEQLFPESQAGGTP